MSATLSILRKIRAGHYCPSPLPGKDAYLPGMQSHWPPARGVRDDNQEVIASQGSPSRYPAAVSTTSKWENISHFEASEAAIRTLLLSDPWFSHFAMPLGQHTGTPSWQKSCLTLFISSSSAATLYWGDVSDAVSGTTQAFWSLLAIHTV